MAWLAGFPRENINWHPTIDPDKCVKCGMCMNCGQKVYKWTEEGPVVAHLKIVELDAQHVQLFVWAMLFHFPTKRLFENFIAKMEFGQRSSENLKRKDV